MNWNDSPGFFAVGLRLSGYEDGSLDFNLEWSKNRISDEIIIMQLRVLLKKFEREYFVVRAE